MKFDKRFLAKMVPEMKQHYLDYKLLREQIALVRKAALTLGSAFADLNETTEQSTQYTIAVGSLEPEMRFWQLLQDSLFKVESWYNETMEKHLSRFHDLVFRTVQIGLIQRYIPIERAQTTVMDREIERLGLAHLVPWKTTKTPPKIPMAAKCLVAITRGSDLAEVIMRSSLGYHESRLQSKRIIDDFDSEDDIPLASLLSMSSDANIKAKNKKAEEPMPDLPLPIWDEEDDFDNTDPDVVRVPRNLSASSPSDQRRFRSFDDEDDDGFRNEFDFATSSTYTGQQPSTSSIGHSRSNLDPFDHTLAHSQPSLRHQMNGSSLSYHRTSGDHASLAMTAPVPKNKVDQFFDDDDREEGLVEYTLTMDTPLAAHSGPTPIMANTHHRNQMHHLNSSYSSHYKGTSTDPVTPSERRQIEEVRHVQSSAYLLQREWAEFYRDLHLLKQFALLNVEAISKLLNKHDKIISSGAKHKFLDLEGSSFAFLRREHLRLLIRESEHVYAQAFTGGHRTEAMNQLRIPNEAQAVGMATFRFGFFLGISVVMGFLILFVCLITDSAYLIKLRPGLIVFRSLGLATLILWCWAVILFVCTRYRINFMHIFEFQTKHQYQQKFEAAALGTLLITGCMLLFVLSATQKYEPGFMIPGLAALSSIPPPVLPLSTFVIFFILNLISQARSGWWEIKSLARVVSSPFFPVTYQDFHTAEYLLSSVIVLADLEFSMCYFISDAFRSNDTCAYKYRWITLIVVCCPSVWRALQCIRRYLDMQETRNLLNASKYSLGLVVSLLSYFARVLAGLGNFWVGLWGIAITLLAVVNTYWDIREDWSLGEIQVKYPWLRSELLLPPRIYYVAMFTTPVSRVLFGFTLSPDIISSWLNPDVLTTILAVFELASKTLWSIIRLENEQIFNADHYRAMADEIEMDPYAANVEDAYEYV